MANPQLLWHPRRDWDGLPWDPDDFPIEQGRIPNRGIGTTPDGANWPLGAADTANDVGAFLYPVFVGYPGDPVYNISNIPWSYLGGAPQSAPFTFFGAFHGYGATTDFAQIEFQINGITGGAIGCLLFNDNPAGLFLSTYGFEEFYLGVGAGFDDYIVPTVTGDVVVFVEMNFDPVLATLNVWVGQDLVLSQSIPGIGTVIDDDWPDIEDVEFYLDGNDASVTAGVEWASAGMGMVRAALTADEREELRAFFFDAEATPAVSAPDRYVAAVVKPTLGTTDGSEVWILDRSLERRLHPVYFKSCKWNRVIDDRSEASAAIPLEFAAQGLGGITPWRHGLGVWIQGERQWSGPITNIKRAPGDPDAIELTARDRLAWMDRRYVHTLIEGFLDYGVFFDLLIAEGTVRDNRFGLFSSTPVTGVAGQKSYAVGANSSIFQALQELARDGMDFAMADNVVHSGPTNRLFGETPILVHGDAFLGRIGAEFDGLSQVNSANTAGAGTGGANGYTVLGQFEEWDHDIGLLEDFIAEEAVRDTEAAIAASRQRWEKSHNAPAIISFPPLSPSFPSTLRQLIPGKRVRLNVTDDVFDLPTLFRITQVSWQCEVGGDGGQETTVALDMDVV